MVQTSVGMLVVMVKVKNIPVRALSAALPQPSPPTRTLTPIPYFASGCMAAYGGGLGASEDPLRDLSAAQRGGARSGGQIIWDPKGSHVL
jgi:hypothetical protein